MIRPGDELAELLWDDDGPALRAPPQFPAAPFQPFSCSAAGSSRAREVQKRHHPMDDVLRGGIPVHHGHDDDDAVPWLHCPVIDDGGGDSEGTAPLPPEYCAGLLSSSGFSSGLHAVPDPTPPTSLHIARPSSHAAVAATRAVPLEPAPAHPPQPSGEGVMNFSFFSRPLQRPQPPAAAASPSNPLESTVAQAAASRLRNTPLFSEQRMAWLQPPPSKVPPRVAAPQPPPLSTDHHVHVEAAGAIATQQQQQQQQGTQTQVLQAPDARATVTTSSVCSGNGDQRSHSQTKRTLSHQQQQECSVSPDEDMDGEPGGAARRSAAARGTKRSRTADVHNLSERRRRDRINEKMRALQELIPNCNKVDTASMLEEAIEYLKTLQLQLQLMSMGTAGLCVPPAAMLMHMQMQMQLPPVAAAPFPHLGLGLGFAGMGGAYDMLPRFAAAAGAQFAMAAIQPGAMFGMVPGQAVPPPFGHVSGAAPAEQREPAPPAADQGDHQKQT